MTCCAPGAESAARLVTAPEEDEETLFAASREIGDGLRQIELAVPDIHCASCMTTIESAVRQNPMVEQARVNFSTKRIRIAFRPGRGALRDLPAAISRAGYRAFVLDPSAETGKDQTLSTLMRALAVSGFAAGNIMLFSVSIWSGADAVTRDLFHWISALIAIPAVAYAGQPFFRSAWAGLRNRNLNMDVPISLAVTLSLLVSLIETINHGRHAYFDASVTLLFFLLIGRTLDHVMRERARGAVRNLARLSPRHAIRLNGDGTREDVAISEITPDMTLLIAAGQRVPVDGDVVSGESDIDMSLVTGETVPEHAQPGVTLLAGSTNLTGSLTLRATRPAAESFLARMISLMEAAEGSRSGYRRIADRAARAYSPVVHILALSTFFGWGILGGDWHTATLNAIAVLIITCPCALALAVPIVHVVVAGRLFENGVLMRDGGALERLAQITRIAFDKTGTLTLGKPVWTGQSFGPESYRAAAIGLALHSGHPLSAALAATGTGLEMTDVREVPGQGVEGRSGDATWRLGRSAFCGAHTMETGRDSEVWLSRNGEPVAAFTFADRPRPEAEEVVTQLQASGMPVILLSGDREGPVLSLAKTLGIADAHSGLTPSGKLDILKAFADKGEKVLMVGDGINDAPALAAAHVSMAPSSATDVGRNAADFVFMNDGLAAVPFSLDLARRASTAVLQNFGLAIAYNIVAVPLAVTGHVTPLVAAAAMSSSSVLVTLNALRLRLGGQKPASPNQETAPLLSSVAVPAE